MLLVASGCSTSYYERCLSDEDCDDEQQCELFLALDGFCTRPCLTSESCASAFGDGSYCAVSQSCFHSCEQDADCPRESRCFPERYCGHTVDE